MTTTITVAEAIEAALDVGGFYEHSPREMMREMCNTIALAAKVEALEAALDEADCERPQVEWHSKIEAMHDAARAALTSATGAEG